MNHLLFEHLFLDPERYPDHQALLVTTEVTANKWIQEPLLLAHFPTLPPDEDTHTRYHRLVEERTGENGEAGCSPKSAPGDQKMVPHVPNSGPDAPKSGSSHHLSACPTSLDDHTLWDTARSSGPLGQMAVHVLIQEVAHHLSAAQWQRLPTTLQQRVETLCRGDMPG